MLQVMVVPPNLSISFCSNNIISDTIYSLYIINFQLLPPCLLELDVNWPQADIRSGRAHTMPTMPHQTSRLSPTIPDQSEKPSDKVRIYKKKYVYKIIKGTKMAIFWYRINDFGERKRNYRRRGRVRPVRQYSTGFESKNRNGGEAGNYGSSHY